MKKYHIIENFDSIPPFFMTLVSPCDLWLFISSTGGLTAGRKSPEKCIFPYETVDKLTESWRHTGQRTFFRISDSGRQKKTCLIRYGVLLILIIMIHTNLREI